MIGAIEAFASPGPGLVVGIALIVIGALLFAAARMLPAPLAAVALPEAPPAARVAEPERTGPVTHHERAIGWPRLIDPDAGELTLEERRRVIDGLAVIGDGWCASILGQAYTDEGETLREAVIDAIGRCSGEVEPTLERALKSHRVVERYAAMDAASRRGDIALLERGLKDTDGTVALAAAYGLVRARRPELIEAGLAGRDDARANEIRRILPVLA